MSREAREPCARGQCAYLERLLHNRLLLASLWRSRRTGAEAGLDGMGERALLIRLLQLHDPPLGCQENLLTRSQHRSLLLRESPHSRDAGSCGLRGKPSVPCVDVDSVHGRRARAGCLCPKLRRDHRHNPHGSAAAAHAHNGHGECGGEGDDENEEHRRHQEGHWPPTALAHGAGCGGHDGRARPACRSTERAAPPLMNFPLLLNRPCR